MDENGYPDEEELEKIRTWDPTDPLGLLAFVCARWHFGDWGWHVKGHTYHLSTGGWSGNEDLINAMQANYVFWALCWHTSRRGGHYTLVIPARFDVKIRKGRKRRNNKDNPAA